MILLQLALNGLRPSRRVSTPHAEIYNGRSSFSLEGLALTFCGLSRMVFAHEEILRRSSSAQKVAIGLTL
jgi:hypothetical protein